jgi:serine protease Do
MNLLSRSCLVILFALTLPLTGPAAPAKDRVSPIELARQLNQAFIDVAESVSPAVVVISVAHVPGSSDLQIDENHPFFEMLPPEFRQRLEEQREKRKKKDKSEPDEPRDPVFDSQGSGVVIRKDGFIVTNRHVVEGGEKIRIRFRDGTELEATVRGVDTQSDLAVLKVDPGGRSLPVARLGDSSKVRVGEFAIAIGAPLELDYSVTFGHISAKGRSRIIDDPSMDQDFLQTDANINPGNSGGPLVNIDGEVVGINTLIRGMHTGIGFAIPSNLVREITEQLISRGRVMRAYLGVRIRGWRENSGYRTAIPGVKDGVVIFAIPNEGPAAKSDLKPGDVITAVDGHPVATPQDLRNEIRSRKLGASVTLDVHRFGKNIKVGIRPEAWPESEEDKTVHARRTSSSPKPRALGIVVEDISKKQQATADFQATGGVRVTEVETGSLAEQYLLQPGDIIQSVDLKPVTSAKQFNEALKKSDPANGILLHFVSRGARRFEILMDRR